MRRYPILIASIVCTVGTSTASMAAPAECRPDSRDARALFPDAPDVVHVLNGKLIANETHATLTPELIKSIWILCDAVDLFQVFGFKAKRGAVIIFTKPGPEATLKASLDSLGVLQQTYRARKGTFTTRLADLGWSDPSGLITVDLNVTESGDRWTATGTHRYLMYFKGPSSVITVSGSR